VKCHISSWFCVAESFVYMLNIESHLEYFIWLTNLILKKKLWLCLKMKNQLNFFNVQWILSITLSIRPFLLQLYTWLNQRMVEGVNSNMICLIYYKNFCKCHSVLPASTTIKNKIKSTILQKQRMLAEHTIYIYSR
jgi:hypothetical protein